MFTKSRVITVAMTLGVIAAMKMFTPEIKQKYLG